MNNINFPVLEVFTSIQGEGKWTGMPSIFVRVGGCNLRCVFGSSRCDTPYSSFELEKPIANTVYGAIALVRHEFEKHPNVRHLVITGGEPMLYKEQIKVFYEAIVEEYDPILTIETNGSLPALDIWGYDYGNEDADFNYWVDLWSVSPKLSTSVDHNRKFLTKAQADDHNAKRINIDNLASYWNTIKKVRFEQENDCYIQFKFVYSGEDSVTEIKEVMEKVAEKVDVPVETLYEYVMLMPEGTNNEQLERISKECADVCIREGWQFCDRLHIRIWGDKRGV